jgi:hypothetical protein
MGSAGSLSAAPSAKGIDGPGFFRDAGVFFITEFVSLTITDRSILYNPSTTQ